MRKKHFATLLALLAALLGAATLPTTTLDTADACDRLPAPSRH